MEEITDLEAFIDHYYNRHTMEDDTGHVATQHNNPNKRKKTDSSTDTDDLGTVSSLA